jgi:hypothetical protein
MWHVDKMINEMSDLEADLLLPFDLDALEGYYFYMETVNDNGNWLGQIVMPDEREVTVVYNHVTGVTKYRKDEAYYDFVRDAKQIFPLDSCALDTMSALLALAESYGWETEFAD